MEMPVITICNNEEILADGYVISDDIDFWSEEIQNCTSHAERYLEDHKIKVVFNSTFSKWRGGKYTQFGYKYGHLHTYDKDDMTSAQFNALQYASDMISSALNKLEQTIL